MNKISKICEIVNGEIYGDIDLDILGVCDIEVGKENHISFILNHMKIIPNCIRILRCIGMLLNCMRSLSKCIRSV